MRTGLLAAASIALLASACQKHNTAAASNAVVDTTIGADQPAQPNATAATAPTALPAGNVVADAVPPAPEVPGPATTSSQVTQPVSPTPPRSAPQTTAAPAEERSPVVTPAPAPPPEREPDPESVRHLTEQQAIDLALATGSAQQFGSNGDGGSVRVRDVHSPSDPRQCRAYAVIENGAPSTWSVACHDSDGRWRLAR